MLDCSWLILDLSIYAHSYSRSRLWANTNVQGHTQKDTHQTFCDIIFICMAWLILDSSIYAHSWSRQRLWANQQRLYSARLSALTDSHVWRDSLWTHLYMQRVSFIPHTQDFGFISSGCGRETQRYRDGDAIGIYTSQKWVTSHIWMSDVAVTHFNERWCYPLLPLLIACVSSAIAHMDESGTSHVTHLKERCCCHTFQWVMLLSHISMSDVAIPRYHY